MPAGLVKWAHTGPDPQAGLWDDISMNLGAPGSPCLPSKGSAILWPPQLVLIICGGHCNPDRLQNWCSEGTPGVPSHAPAEAAGDPAAWSPSKVLPGGRSPGNCALLPIPTRTLHFPRVGPDQGLVRPPKSWVDLGFPAGGPAVSHLWPHRPSFQWASLPFWTSLQHSMERAHDCWSLY